jgi:predicted outer membrane repeat protein
MKGVIGQIEEETENSITIFYQFVGGTNPFNQLITYTVTYDGSTYTLTENIAGNSGGAIYSDTDEEVCF